MIVLALDTAMAGCSAAVYDSARDEILAERFVTVDKGHAEAIAPMIAELMSKTRVPFDKIGRIGVTIGPGTFTGVRAGLAMARGFGLALGVPVVGIDTLSAIACNAPEGENKIAVAADARRGEVYFGLFDADLVMLHEPAVLPVKEAIARLPSEPLGIIGTAAEAIIAAAARKPLTRLAGDLPRASAFVAELAKLPAGKIPPEPLYLRAPDAQPQFVKTAHRSFEIHGANGEAAELLAALHAECFDNPWSRSEMARLLASPGIVAMIAESGAQPCAFLIAREAADEAEILTVGTRPFARRQGAARALVDRLGRSLASGGTQALFIEVAENNGAAQGLYEGLGFARAGQRRNYYERPGGAREDAVVMRKDLKA